MKKTPTLTGFRKQLTTGVLLVNFAIIAFVGISIYESRIQYEERATTTTQNLSQVLEEYIKGVISKVDVALQSVVDESEEQLSRGGMNRQAINTFIKRQFKRIPELDGLRMTDKKGDIVYGSDVRTGSSVSVADRDYFIHLRNDPEIGLFISKPVVSRFTGREAIMVARRYNRPNGSFAGEVHGVLFLQNLAETFSRVNVGKHGSITLINSEFSIICRYPEPRKIGSVMGKKITTKDLRDLIDGGQTSGTYRVRSSVDDVERVFSYRKISSHPLYIVVGLAKDDYLADWRKDIVKMFVLSALLISITLGFAWMIDRYFTAQQKYEELLHNLSTTDELTGLANRRAFDSFLNKEWLRALREKYQITIMMIDVDFFKKYNDAYGHLKGDECLKLVAAILKKTARRPWDIVARFGGEEFAVVLSDTDIHHAVSIAEKIRRDVEGLNIRHEQSKASDYVTVSIGVASIIPQQNRSPLELIEYADTVLYKAKEEGRNRTFF